MATFKCNDPIYTILRNGKVITMSARPATAVGAIIDDASRNVCPPDCCITGFNIDIDSFDVLITSPNSDGMYVRVTVTSGGNDYSTSWVAAAATNTIDITGLIVEFGDWEDGNTICVEYSYDQETVIEGCCTTVVIPNAQFNENNTYQLSEVVTECDGGVFDLAFQNPDGGVTVDPTGEMVIPELEEYETVFVTYSCDDCVSELLILTAKDVAGLRLGFYDIENTPVADPNSVSDWNTFWDLPTNGIPFSSVIVTSNEVKLIGGGNLIIKDFAFQSSTAIDYLIDESGVIIEVGDASFASVVMSEFTANSMVDAGLQSFAGASTITTFNATSLENAGQDCFSSLACTTFNALNLVNLGMGCFSNSSISGAYTFNSLLTVKDDGFLLASQITALTMPILTTLGSTTSFDRVFLNMTLLANLTVPAALATVDGGNPDGDLVYASGTLGTTINYI